MQKRKPPSFLGAKRTGAPQGELLGRMNPLARRSSRCAPQLFQLRGGQSVDGSVDRGGARLSLDTKGHAAVEGAGCRAGPEEKGRETQS